jgi:hypothetical protein
MNVWSFVARRPVTVSAVTWSLMLITTKVVLDLREDVSGQWWANVSVLTACAYSVGASWYFQSRAVAAGAPPGRPLGIDFSIAVAPWLTAVALVLVGAAPWTLWAALAVVGALLVWIVWRLRATGAPSS